MKKTLLLVALIIILIVASVIIYRSVNPITITKNALKDRDNVELKDTSSEDENIEMDIDYDNTISLTQEPDITLETEVNTQETESSEPQEESAGKGYGDFYVYDYDGQRVTLSSKVSQGKPVIINFWTTWCGYCKSEMPDFNNKYIEYGDRIEFMMVDINGGGNDNIDKAKSYIEEEGFDFPVYFDTDLNALSTYYTDGFPATIVIDSSGNVVYARSGMLTEAQLQSIIDQII